MPSRWWRIRASWMTEKTEYFQARQISAREKTRPAVEYRGASCREPEQTENSPERRRVMSRVWWCTWHTVWAARQRLTRESARRTVYLHLECVTGNSGGRPQGAAKALRISHMPQRHGKAVTGCRSPFGRLWRGTAYSMPSRSNFQMGVGAL